MNTSSELIRDFVNTLHKDPAGNEEELTTPAELVRWLSAHALLGGKGRATARDVQAAVQLREALRVLLLANNGVEVDTAPAYGVLDAAARRARVELRFGSAGPGLAPGAAGVRGALGGIAAAVQAALADGSWPRLKACRARDCEWAFLDTAKNQSRAWCSMRSCGNREKARAFRRRQSVSS